MGCNYRFKEDKIIFEQMLTQDQIHELYEYSLKVKPISLRILTESSEWNNSEYIDIELLQDYYIIKFWISEQQLLHQQ
jgi:hydroxymethylpyrimidine pyrophosphatase-like HAD family hydrolase